ncbi:MAG: MFS transporter [Chloroflexi bacterium]|nr:MAG: MFS transporter [Chloroflexota bacterium]
MTAAHAQAAGMLLGRATFAPVMERTRPRIGLSRDFDRLWLGESVSAVGTQLTALAIPTLAIFQLHATPFDVGVLTACTFAGYPLVGILGAPLIDRIARRSMLLVMNILRAAALATVPLAGAFGLVSLGQLALVALIVSGATALFDTAYQSAVPQLVREEELLGANARLETSQSAANFAGPALAGWLIGIIGALATIVGDAVSYLWSALMVSLISIADDPPRVVRPNPVRDIASSFVLWRRYSALVALAACVVISNVGNMAVRTALLLVAYRVFALGPDGAGWILAVGGLASVIGATLAGPVSARLGVGPSLALATTVEGLAWAIAPLGFLVTPLVVLGVASIVSGLMTPVWNVNVVTLRQRIVARDEQGRVVAVSRAFATAGVALGAFAGGVAATVLEASLGERVGLVTAMTAGAIVAGLSAIPLLTGGVVRLTTLPRQADAS